MKDPLQTEPTPHEVLGVDRGAGRDDIEKAFKRAIVRRVPVTKATRARNDLLDPLKRAFWEVRLYDDAVLRMLDPCPLDDGSILLPRHRAATAAAWESHLRERFPDARVAHSLALLWYWWAKHEEGRFLSLLQTAMKAGPLPDGKMQRDALLKQACKTEGIDCDPGRRQHCTHEDCPWREDCFSSVPALPDVWQRVIGYWCMVEVTRTFWEALPNLPADRVRPLRYMLMDDLKHTLHALSQQYATCLDGGSSDGFPRTYRSLLLALERERKTARTVVKAGIRNNRGKVCCGVLVLRQMGWLGRVCKVAEERKLQDLREALDRHYAIKMLLDANRPEEALEYIRGRPSEERRSNELRDLEARALHLLGKQEASLHRYEEAMDRWAEALNVARSDAMKKEIRKEVVSTARTQALSMGENRRDDAIALLEKALALVDDEQLRARLADLLMQRGVHEFLEGRKQVHRAVPAAVEAVVGQANSAVDRGDWDGAIRRLEEAREIQGETSEKQRAAAAKALERCEKAMKDLERALELGRQDARQQLDAAHDQMTDMGLADWRKRVTHRLATCLTNRAVDKANRAIQVLSQAAKERQEMIERMARMASGDFGQLGGLDPHRLRAMLGMLNEGRCGVPGCSQHAQFTMKTAGGHTMQLCAQHAEEFRTPPRPQEALDLLESAEDDLLRADEFDPGNSRIDQNLTSLHKAMADVGLSPARRRTSRRARRKAKPKAGARATARTTASAAAPARQAGGKKGETSGLAVASLVLGLLALFGLGPVAGIPGAIFGHVALSRITKAYGTVGGKGVAIAGLVLSYIGIAWVVVRMIADGAQ